jgi:arginyl-tRNA synthetase
LRAELGGEPGVGSWLSCLLDARPGLAVRIAEKLRHKIIQEIARAAQRAKEAGELDFDQLPQFVLEVPREKSHGDYAANIAMTLTRVVKKPPRQIAEILLKHLKVEGTWIKETEIAGPGFINLTLDPGWLVELLPKVEEADRDYGTSDLGAGKKVQVEFVSANPTGLLHMGNARGAALGDSIAGLLAAVGFAVTREYFINDAGNQIENFAKSLETRYFQQLGKDASFPEDGYHGADVSETVKGFIAKVGDKYLNAGEALRREMLVDYALKEKLSLIRASLTNFGVNYDQWFSEQSLHDSGRVGKVVTKLKEQGYIYENEGALWFKTAGNSGDKDEVVVRSNGTPTYFAADIAYHQEKFERGFDWVINIWGADHHGHVARLKGAVTALGFDPNKLDVVLMQLVRLFQGGEIVRMSKRTGQYITLDELVEEVGQDAARYFFVMRNADSHLDFDLDLAKSKSSDNPVYYVQYAHARICSILRQGQERGHEAIAAANCKLALLQEPAELELLKKIADYPEEIAQAAMNLEPYRMARYAHELAGLFHSFYNSCRVLTEEQELRDSRLALVNGTRITLRNMLELLGVTAPERM